MKKLIIVKIGSSLLTNSNGQLALDKIKGHVKAISNAKKTGVDIVFVTSASIAAGFEKLGFTSRPKALVSKQACAAVGQGMLMQYYNEFFAEDNITVAQILLTKRDFAERESLNNALNTLTFLLEHDVIPIINQNDTTATEEISFGDNDSIAARVASLLHADLCLLLTDIAGLYDSNPQTNKDAKQISVVEEITPEIIAMTGDSISGVGTGGMRSKVLAAELSTSMGVPLFIADGRGVDEDRIIKVLNGVGEGTLFKANSHDTSHRKKQWISLYASVHGTIIVDDGASDAIVNEGRSLLPVGVKEVFGSFKAGDVVEVRDMSHHILGKGISNYSTENLLEKIGNDFEETLSNQRLEVIHRDDWVAN